MIVNNILQLYDKNVDCDQGKILYITELIIVAAW